jgi:hypothetical protein
MTLLASGGLAMSNGVKAFYAVEFLSISRRITMMKWENNLLIK